MIIARYEIMDLLSRDLTEDANNGSELVLIDPYTDEEIDIKIKLLGADSDIYQDASRKALQKLSRKKGSKISQDNVDEAIRATCSIYAKVTVEWSNLEMDGKPFACNYENAFEVYLKFKWIREQVQKFIEERSNFMPSSRKV